MRQIVSGERRESTLGHPHDSGKNFSPSFTAARASAKSGAFLLGHMTEGQRRVEQIVYYDDLDPHAYRTGVVIMHAASFGRLWEQCRSSALSVIADIHVHPKGAFQSAADPDNPMIAIPGHLALIVPYFARPPIALDDLGLFKYRGSHRWRKLGGPRINPFLHIEC